MIHQKKYAQKILSRFHLEEANIVAIPTDNHQNLSSDGLEETPIPTNVPYKEAVGSLLYLAVVSRPDIAFAVSEVSQYSVFPKKIHWNAVKRILKYIKGTLDYGILFKSRTKDFRLEAFSDADYARDQATGKSISGFLIRLNDSPISWGSRKQTHVSLSTTESEYVASTEAVKHLIWINELAKSSDAQQGKPILYVDN